MGKLNWFYSCFALLKQAKQSELSVGLACRFHRDFSVWLQREHREHSAAVEAGWLFPVAVPGGMNSSLYYLYLYLSLFFFFFFYLLTTGTFFIKKQDFLSLKEEACLQECSTTQVNLFWGRRNEMIKWHCAGTLQSTDFHPWAAEPQNKGVLHVHSSF